MTPGHRLTASRKLVLRWVIVCLVALAAAFQVVRSAAVTLFVPARPELAARFWPGHPRVAMAVSMAEIGHSAARGQPASPKTMARVREAARRAPLAVEPFLIEGAIATATARAGQAERLFVESKRRDARSPAARYFLAQHYLSTGRIVEGLNEAAVLTRLVPAGMAALVPGLAQYARTPGAVPNLRRMFALEPRLGGDVLALLARDADNAELVGALAGDPVGRASPPGAPPWSAQLLRTLLERGERDRAYALWLRVSGLRQKTPGLFNPQFLTITAPPPFNWTLSSGDFGVAEPVAPGSLQIFYYGRADADFATQTLLLSPGSYELRMQVTRDTDKDGPSGLSWSVACQPGGRTLLQLPVTGASGPASPLGGRFVVPANCSAQLLKLDGTAREFTVSEQVVIANLQLVEGAR